MAELYRARVQTILACFEAQFSIQDSLEVTKQWASNLPDCLPVTRSSCGAVFLSGNIYVSTASSFMWVYVHVWLSYYSLIFLKVVFLFGCLPVRLSSCAVVFLWGCFPVMLSTCEVLFLWACLPVRLSSCEVVFLWGCLHVGSSSCDVVLLWGCLSVRSSSFEIVFL